MARSGILYSDVARAAGQLMQTGQALTVDNVRKVMGDTGSKSTITPMLRRWREENQSLLLEKHNALPDPILNSVKGIYELMQTECSNKLHELQILHKQQQQEHKAETDVLRDSISRLDQEKRTLQTTTLEQQEVISQLSKDCTTLRQQSDDATTEIKTLLEKIKSRDEQIKTLSQQLERSRVQFEHFQHTTGQQRQDERKQLEHQIQRLNTECENSRRNQLSLQNINTKLEAQVHYLQTENAQLSKSLKQQTLQIQEVGKISDETQFLLRSISQEKTDAVKEISRLNSLLHELQISHAVVSNAMATLESQCQERKNQWERAEQEKIQLLNCLLEIQQQKKPHLQDTGDLPESDEQNGIHESPVNNKD
jgi:chromosome segregation ATPase